MTLRGVVPRCHPFKEACFFQSAQRSGQHCILVHLQNEVFAFPSDVILKEIENARSKVSSRARVCSASEHLAKMHGQQVVKQLSRFVDDAWGVLLVDGPLVHQPNTCRTHQSTTLGLRQRVVLGRSRAQARRLFVKMRRKNHVAWIHRSDIFKYNSCT